MISATYQVTGMTCEHCIRAVREELTALAGVTGVTIQTREASLEHLFLALMKGDRS